MYRSIIRTSRYLVRRQINNSLKHTPCSIALRHKGVLACNNTIIQLCIRGSHNTISSDGIEPAVFEKICSETLESLFEYFEVLIDQSPQLRGADITFSDGVLTVALGSNYGTYVINRQTPNKQIWLSSPVSGPKRYDLELKNGGYWVYKHDGVSLHNLLQNEISKIVDNVDFKDCAHSVV
ncbi:putative frataxin [Danaus plexippus plexippus]|uniref:ferroxidase n=1 Tax=Danaus plexippus plexippus TaxID=278856 RepID=A0A212FNV3_DANPL|nr:putative frataxin [Danaus plexippus plexippus]